MENKSEQPTSQPTVSSPITTLTSSYISRLFNTRINRSTYWEGYAVLLLAFIIIFIPIILTLIFLKINPAYPIFLSAAIFSGFFYISLGVRRLHDLSNRWYLILPSLLTFILRITIMTIGIVLSGQSESKLDQYYQSLENYTKILPFNFLLQILDAVTTLLGIYIAFFPGTKGENKYGPPQGFLNLKQTFNTVLGLKTYTASELASTRSQSTAANSTASYKPSKIPPILIWLLIGMLIIIIIILALVVYAQMR